MKELIEFLRELSGKRLGLDRDLMNRAALVIEEQAATIARYETTAENYELLQVKVDEQAREIERLEAEVEDVLVDWGQVRLELAALKAQSGNPAKKGCTKPGCFPYCDCGSVDDYQSGDV